MLMKFVIARYYFNSLFRAEANESFIADLKKEPFVDDGAYMYALGNFQNLDFTFVVIPNNERPKVFNCFFRV